MVEVEVVRGKTLKVEATTLGIARGKAFESDTATFSRSSIARGVVSAWHHHGERDLYGFVVSGTLRFEYGHGGLSSVQLESGDFLHISPGVVHRDVNPSQDRDCLVVSVLIGKGPTIVNVDGPEL